MFERVCMLKSPFRVNLCIKNEWVLTPRWKRFLHGTLFASTIVGKHIPKVPATFIPSFQYPEAFSSDITVFTSRKNVSHRIPTALFISHTYIVKIPLQMIGLMRRIHNSEIATASKGFKAFRVCENEAI